MEIPPLFSIANPYAPRWIDLRPPAEEAAEIIRRLIIVVGYDDVEGAPQILGTGFIVGTNPDLLAITATHILTEWADRVRPSKPHGLSGIVGDGEDLRDRLHKLINANLIRAIVLPKPPARHRLCKIMSLTISTDPRHIDVTSLRLIPPPGTHFYDFNAFAVDVEPAPLYEPVLMAGVVRGHWVPPDIEDEPFELRADVLIRAGYLHGLVHDAPAFHCPMFHVNMPSRAGMSGGPLITLRRPAARASIISSERTLYANARGVISRDCASPSLILDGSDPGETWVAPIEDAFLLRLDVTGSTSMSFGDAVRERRVASFGPRSQRAVVRWLDEERAALSFDAIADDPVAPSTPNT